MNLKTKLFTLATILSVCSISELNAAPAVNQDHVAKLSVNDHERYMPLFSDENNEHWYFISYANGGRVFTDNGEGKAMTHTGIWAKAFGFLKRPCFSNLSILPSILVCQ